MKYRLGKKWDRNMFGDIEIRRCYFRNFLLYFFKSKSVFLKITSRGWNNMEAAILRNEDFKHDLLVMPISLGIVLDLTIINRAKSPQSSFDL